MTSSAPPSLYAHPDPLLSRLRLNGSSGQPLLKPTSPDSELRDAAVIAFVFGEQVHRENQDYGKKLYKGIDELCRRSPHRIKCIYVSLDPDEDSFTNSLRGKPWLSCIWHDGSNSDRNVSMLQTPYDEDFVHSQLEDKTLAPIAKAGAYMRPLSRVGLATKFDVLSAPTIAIYHIPSASILSSRLKPAELRSDTIDASIAAWLEGKSSPTALKSTIPNLGEVAYRMRWSLALAAIALLYQLLLVWGGDTFSISPLLQQIFAPSLMDKQIPSHTVDEHGPF